MTLSYLTKPFSLFLLMAALSTFSLGSLAADNKGNIEPPDNHHSEMVALVVDINTADAQEIADSLKGIGLKKAQAIVQWREDNGNFTHLEQLLEVKGIGDKILELNRKQLTL